MKRLLTFSGMLCCMLASVCAQPQTMSGFVAGAITQNNTYSVMGQPFVGQSAGVGYQVSEGIAQSQLVRETYLAVVNEDAGYSQHGFDYPAGTDPGMYQGRIYIVHGAAYNYDLLKLLKLVVLGPFTCGDLVYDADLHEYRTAEVAGNCWTVDNLRSEHYADGAPVAGMAYQSALHPDASSNLDTYGYLYSWHSAVNVPEGSGTAPATDDNGHVQGLCPWGWHVPTAAEAGALLDMPATSLRSETHWLSPNANDNATGFTALPAGLRNAVTDRFEGLLTWTGFWTDEAAASGEQAAALQLPYYCDDPLIGLVNCADALSVRCVKDINN